MDWSRYRFALKPKWILSHLFVFALVCGMIWAMFWQLGRLHEKKARNKEILDRRLDQPLPVQQVVPPGSPYSATSKVEFRLVVARGHYLVDDSVLVRYRSRNSSPGSWIVTPLDLGDGVAVAVNRGWVPNDGSFNEVPARYRAPSGPVTVSGFIRQTETRGQFGSKDPTSGDLRSLARLDVARIDQQVPERLLPLYVQLQGQDPAIKPADPRPVPAPALDEGPHLSYAIQWAIFSTVALVGYPLILRRRAGEIEQEERDAEWDRLHPDGDDPGGADGERVDLDEPDPADEPAAGDPRLDPVTDP